MNRFLIVSLLVLLATSCSTIEFVQNGQTPYKVSSILGSEKVVEVVGETPFYFWGILPERAEIDFDKVFFEKGVHHPSMVKVERMNTFSSVFWTVVTFGFYMPEPFKISVYSTGEEH